MSDIEVREPLQATPQNLRLLQELVHLPGELQRAGYVLDPITGSELERKKRCVNCCKVLKKERQRKSRAESKLPLASTSSSAKTPSHLATASEEGETAVQIAAPRPYTDEDTNTTAPSLAHVAGDGTKEPRMICNFHPGKVAYRKWTCCGGPVFAKPCSGEQLHSPRQYRKGELETNWKFYETPSERLPTHKEAIVIDCEMGTAASGESELIRVSIVDFITRAVLLDCLVYPDVKMAHYNTSYSGVTRQSMEDARRRRTCIFGRDNARRAVFKFAGCDTIVVGHAGQQDLNSLRWIHRRIIDTLILETKKRQAEVDTRIATEEDGSEASKQVSDNDTEERKEPEIKQEGGLSLKYLALKRLDRVIQIKGRGHDSLEDALATRDLLYWHVIQGLKNI